jgi:hypothetical protein
MVVSGMAFILSIAGPVPGQPNTKVQEKTQNDQVRSYFEQALKDHVFSQYRAFLNKVEYPRRYLQEFELRWPRWRENELNLPTEIFNSYRYYLQTVQDRDIGSVRAFRVPMARIEVYAVRVTTDGDDGWLEIFDGKGKLLGAARTYLEIVSWLPISNSRR